MRHGRAKSARKTLQYFGRTIGLKAPYTILLDATMVVAMFQQKLLPFKERMDRVLQSNHNSSTSSSTTSGGPNRYCITQTAVEELEMIYKGLHAKNHSKAGSFQQALEFIQNECIILNDHYHSPDTEETTKEDSKNSDDESHEENEEEKKKTTTSVQDDLLEHIEKDGKPYIAATQDEKLLDTLRSKGTVPIVRLANNSVLILENPSKHSQRQFQGVERKKWTHSLQESEQQLVTLAKRQKRDAAKQSDGNTPVSIPKRSKPKAKGPNPLSCKRKQSGDGKSKESASQKRRQRSKKQKTDSS
eukprot:scaffold4282_cov112-Cylindrotheca_fusiformis.AAC.13